MRETCLETGFAVCCETGRRELPCLGTFWKRFSSKLKGTLNTKLDVILDAHTASAFVLTEKLHGYLPEIKI